MSLLPTNEFLDLPIAYLHQTTTRSQLIYSTSLLMFCLLMATLPFIQIDLTIKSNGVIQTAIGKVTILAPVTGRLAGYYLKENGQVNKGSLMLAIDTFTHHQELAFLSAKIRALDQLSADVRLLLKTSHPPILKTRYYHNNFNQYQKVLQNANYDTQQTKHNYDRYAQLYQKGVITLAEFEQRIMDYKKAVSNQDIAEADFKLKWQAEANQYQFELLGLRKQEKLINNQKKSHLLLAPINGYAIHLNNVQVGDWITENQQLGEISANGTLFAYCYVRPSAIAYIKKDQLVRFRIHSFPNQHGETVMGKVINISEDVMQLDHGFYFKVTCQLAKSLSITQENVSKLKKGMTLTAGFIVAKCSLFKFLTNQAQDLFTALP